LWRTREPARRIRKGYAMLLKPPPVKSVRCMRQELLYLSDLSANTSPTLKDVDAAIHRMAVRCGGRTGMMSGEFASEYAARADWMAYHRMRWCIDVITAVYQYSVPASG
jgi:hypothetical protein